MLCVLDCNFKTLQKITMMMKMTHLLPSSSSQQTQGSLLNADAWPRRTRIPSHSPWSGQLCCQPVSKGQTPREEPRILGAERPGLLGAARINQGFLSGPGLVLPTCFFCSEKHHGVVETLGLRIKRQVLTQTLLPTSIVAWESHLPPRPQFPHLHSPSSPSPSSLTSSSSSIEYLSCKARCMYYVKSDNISIH